MQRSLLGRGGGVLRLLRDAGHSPFPLRVLLDHLLLGPDGVAGGDVLHDGLEDGHHQQEEAEPVDRGRVHQHQQGQNQEGSPQNVRWVKINGYHVENDCLNFGPRRDIWNYIGLVIFQPGKTNNLFSFSCGSFLFLRLLGPPAHSEAPLCCALHTQVRKTNSIFAFCGKIYY